MVSAMRITKLCMLASLASFLAGCGPSDMNVTDVRVIDVSSAPKVDNIQLIRGQEVPLIVVYLKSSVDIRSFVRRYGFTVNSEASVCRGGAVDQVKLFEPYPDIYDTFGPISGNNGVHTSSLREGNAFSYHLYFPVKVTNVEGVARYDLKENPTDVCILLSGGNEIGMGFRSNTVVIPRRVLSKAVSRN